MANQRSKVVPFRPGGSSESAEKWHRGFYGSDGGGMDPWQQSVESRLLSIDGRLGKIEDRLDRMADKFDSRMDILDKKFDSRIDTLDGKLDSRFILSWVGIIGSALGLAGMMAKGFGWL